MLLITIHFHCTLSDEGLCKLCVPKAGSTGRGRRYLPRRQSLDGDEKSEAERLSEAPTGRPAGQSTRRPQRKPGQTRRRNEKGSKTKKKTKKPKRPKKPSQKKPSVGEAQCWQHNIEKECRSCDQVYYYRGRSIAHTEYTNISSILA